MDEAPCTYNLYIHIDKVEEFEKLLKLTRSSFYVPKLLKLIITL